MMLAVLFVLAISAGAVALLGLLLGAWRRICAPSRRSIQTISAWSQWCQQATNRLQN